MAFLHELNEIGVLHVWRHLCFSPPPPVQRMPLSKQSEALFPQRFGPELLVGQGRRYQQVILHEAMSLFGRAAVVSLCPDCMTQGTCGIRWK